MALLLLACHGKVHVIERAELVTASLADAPALGFTASQLQAAWVARLAKEPRLKLLPAEKSADKDEPSARLTLELADLRELSRPPATAVQVVFNLGIRRRVGGGASRYVVTGFGEASLSGSGLEARQEATRRAVRAALDQVVVGSRRQLDALEASDRTLVRSLRSPDASERRLAVGVLAERKNPAAVPALLSQLNDPDADVVRHAMGGLVEVRDVKAVPALIELMNGKEPGFQREVIFALGALGGEEAQAYLYTVSEGHDQPAVREAAKQALEELSARLNASVPVGHEARSERGTRTP